MHPLPYCDAAMPLHTALMLQYDKGLSLSGSVLTCDGWASHNVWMWPQLLHIEHLDLLVLQKKTAVWIL